MESATKTVMTSLPGRIVSYDPATKLAVVEPQVHNGNPIPPLPDVPVKWPRFGGYRLVGPLNAGDEVTLHFHKYDPSRFRASGEVSAANMSRDAGLYAYAVPGSEETSDTYNGPSDGSLRLGRNDATCEIVVTSNQIRLGANAASSGVAKGDVTDSNFQAIKDLFTSWTPVPNDGGAALKTAASTLLFDATASTKVFTQ